MILMTACTNDTECDCFKTFVLNKKQSFSMEKLIAFTDFVGFLYTSVYLGL